MTTTLPLILSVDRVPRSQWGPERAKHQNVAVVYGTPGGDLDVAGSVNLTWKDRLRGKYVTRFEVLVGDQRRKAKLVSTPLTCGDGSHRFDATLDVGFRVHDPAEVVRRNVADALAVVYGYLLPQLRSSARKFGIEEAAEAEDHINRLLGRPAVLPEGLTVYHCSVEIEADAAARQYIGQLRDAQRRFTLGRGVHQADVAAARAAQVLKDIEQEGELARQAARRGALAGTGTDIDSLLRQHLIVHPEDTGRAIEIRAQLEADLHARAELEAQRGNDTFRFMVEKDMIRAADLSMHGAVIPGVSVPALPRQASPQAAPPASPYAPPQSGGRPADPPAPGGPAGPVIWGGVAARQEPPAQNAAGAAGTQGAPGTHDAAGAHDAADAPARKYPVYLVLDASAAAGPFAHDLDRAVGDLITSIARAGSAADLRLSVLAFTDRTDTLLPLSPVGATTKSLPPGAAGPARYAAAFEGVLERLSADMDALKAGGRPVQRPLVVFLAAGRPADQETWPAARERLACHIYAPTVIACGLGDSRAQDVLRIAAHPDAAFLAAPGASAAEHVTGFSVLLRNTVLGLGNGSRSARPDVVVECPAGLVPAARHD